jgi:signal transduction histidine kinase
MTPDAQRQFAEAVEAAKLEALAEFAAGAGHEINNPLAVIAGRAQMLLRDEKDDERRRALALINSQAMRVYEMIADMRVFARPPKPEPRLIQVDEFLTRLVAEMSPAAAQQGTVLRHTVGQVENLPHALQVLADPVQLTVALRALCQNALEALGSGGFVEISAWYRGSDVEIAVSDDGPGIPPEVRPHIFDPFFSARQAGRGLGMGLGKCWRIVTNHGGRITVDSTPGQGTVFTIALPGAEGAA